MWPNIACSCPYHGARTRGAFGEYMVEGFYFVASCTFTPVVAVFYVEPVPSDFVGAVNGFV